MDRRALLAGAAALLATPLAAEAQHAAGKVWRIGFLGAPLSVTGSLFQAFEQSLRDLGYVTGRNIAIEYRSDTGDPVASGLVAREP